MKTTVILSCVFASGFFFFNQPVLKESVNLPAFKTTTSKRSTSAKPFAPVSIVIDKSSYELHVYDAKGWYATYPVVFGNSSLADKKMEGDRNTPEGTFKIMNKRVHEKWDRYMGLDYPTKDCLVKFNDRKRRGEVPANAKPGAGIGIHGVWPHEDFVVDRYKNWTNGCIALKNGDVEEIYAYIPIGTPVTIRK